MSSALNCFRLFSYKRPIGPRSDDINMSVCPDLLFQVMTNLHFIFLRLLYVTVPQSTRIYRCCLCCGLVRINFFYSIHTFEPHVEFIFFRSRSWSNATAGATRTNEPATLGLPSRALRARPWGSNAPDAHPLASSGQCAWPRDHAALLTSLSF